MTLTALKALALIAALCGWWFDHRERNRHLPKE
jgi:hypothetical protein